MDAPLKSSLCTQAQLESEAFRAWCPLLGEGFKLHRKLWEFCYIAQALHERGQIRPGARGLGFGVGREPLVAYFAGRGCEVVATDLAPEQAQEQGWVDGNQHAVTIDHLNERGLCDPERFRERVAYRYVDMNAIPGDLRGFDFTWSSCSLEHLGSIARGADFLLNQMDCLRPGGVAVHTTEFNLSSETETLDDNAFVVLFRRGDIHEIARRLADRGHALELDLTPGDGIADRFVDLPPYGQEPHLRLQWDRFVTTSVGLIIAKDRAGAGSIRSFVGRAARRLLRRGA